MKLRNSFVSNSSSTSFIVHPQDYNEYKDKLDLYSIKDLYNKYLEILRLERSLPGFMSKRFYYDPYSDKLKNTYENFPDSYISDGVDRDWAFDNNLEEELGIFEQL